MKAGNKRNAALNTLKSRPSVQQVKPGTHNNRCNPSPPGCQSVSLLGTAGRFSAATSHEQNDAYMEDFGKAYEELEALSLAGK